MRQFFCLNCDGLIFKSNQIFCSCCLKQVLKMPLKSRFEDGVPHYYLFEWTEETDFFCRKLAYFLKEKPASFFIDLAGQFQRVYLDSESVYVVPGSLRSKNHALELSRAIMKLFGGLGVLDIEGSKYKKKEQKKAKRKERMLWAEESELQGVGLRNWVFVDDVLVSGATFLYAKRCIGGEPKAVLTLFYRPLEMEKDI